MSLCLFGYGVLTAVGPRGYPSDTADLARVLVKKSSKSESGVLVMTSSPLTSSLLTSSLLPSSLLTSSLLTSSLLTSSGDHRADLALPELHRPGLRRALAVDATALLLHPPSTFTRRTTFFQHVSNTTV